jgi:arylsulfatase A-like enzyme
MGFAYNNRSEESWDGDYYGCTPLPLLQNNTVIEQPVNLATLNQRYTDEAVSFIQRGLKQQEPWFLYFAFGHVHTPQYASVSNSGRSKRGVFGDSVAEVDGSVGAVLATIASPAVDQNTLIFFTSDNGAPDAHQHNQPGQQLAAYTGSNHMFTGSKTQTWEGGVREPAIVRWSGSIPTQIRRELSSTLDIFATIADVVEFTLPHDRTFDSHSLLPLLMGTTTSTTSTSSTATRNASFFYQGSKLCAVRVGPFKAHLFTTPPNEGHAGQERGFLNQSGNAHFPYGTQSPWLLFNVEFDPSEMFPLRAKDAAPILVVVKSYVDAHLEELGTPPVGILDHVCTRNSTSRYGTCEVCCDESKECICNAPPRVRAIEACHGMECMVTTSQKGDEMQQ